MENNSKVNKNEKQILLVIAVSVISVLLILLYDGLSVSVGDSVGVLGDDNQIKWYSVLGICSISLFLVLLLFVKGVLAQKKVKK